MPFVILGVLLAALKYLEIGPPAGWAWWIVLSPFGLAVAWWAYADSSGLTAKRQSDKVAAKARKRREKNLEALGISTTKHR